MVSTVQEKEIQPVTSDFSSLKRFVKFSAFKLYKILASNLKLLFNPFKTIRPGLFQAPQA